MTAVYPDVPILVETPARDFFPMVRCHYLSIECDVPDSQWQLGLGGFRMPFLMIGLAGIVHQPLGAPRFNTPEIVEDFFSQVEQGPSLSINFEDIWLPGTMFDSPVHIGDVYRVGYELFRLAYRFRDGQLNQHDFEASGFEFQRQLVISEDETRAFRKWSAEQISAAERLAPKSYDLRLNVKGDRRL